MKDLQFKRLFSLNLFKNRCVPLGEMTFTSDFVNTKAGELYPILEQLQGAAGIRVGDATTFLDEKSGI